MSKERLLDKDQLSVQTLTEAYENFFNLALAEKKDEASLTNSLNIIRRHAASNIRIPFGTSEEKWRNENFQKLSNEHQLELTAATRNMPSPAMQALKAQQQKQSECCTIQ